MVAELASAAAVAQDLPGPNDGEGVFDAGSDFGWAVLSRSFSAGQFGLAGAAAVRDQYAREHLDQLRTGCSPRR